MQKRKRIEADDKAKRSKGLEHAAKLPGQQGLTQFFQRPEVKPRTQSSTLEHAAKLPGQKSLSSFFQPPAAQAKEESPVVECKASEPGLRGESAEPEMPLKSGVHDRPMDVASIAPPSESKFCSEEHMGSGTKLKDSSMNVDTGQLSEEPIGSTGAARACENPTCEVPWEKKCNGKTLPSPCKSVDTPGDYSSPALSLRERLAKRSNSSSLQDALPGLKDSKGTRDVKAQEHSALGGMAVRWRLAFAAPGVRDKKTAEKGQSLVPSDKSLRKTCASPPAASSTSPIVASPCRSSASASSLNTASVPAPTTPTNSRQPARVSTPLAAVAGCSSRQDLSAFDDRHSSSPTTPGQLESVRTPAPSERSAEADTPTLSRRPSPSKEELATKRVSNRPAVANVSSPTGAFEHLQDNRQDASSSRKPGTSAAPELPCDSEQEANRKLARDEEEAPSHREAGTSKSPADTVKELKALLASHGVDCSGCVEKGDLQERWNHFQELCTKPLEELRKSCVEASEDQRLMERSDASECARLLLNRKASVDCTSGERSESNDQCKEEGSSRQQVATREASRLLAMSKASYRSEVAWGCALLGLPARGACMADVQRAFRSHMRNLHPDRAGHSSVISDALDAIQEAKRCCERGLSRLRPPGPPRLLKYKMVCKTAGSRQVHLHWSPPEEYELAPVRQYKVAALDPGFGRAVPVAILEPDYSEQLGRFVPVEELRSYVVVEQDLWKMPRLFKQTALVLHVAAANEAGQSAWSSVRVPLN